MNLVKRYSAKVVIVTKYLTAEEMTFLSDLEYEGGLDLGENRVQSLKSKYAYWGDLFHWHMIGSLQVNKVRDAVAISSMIHSVDSLKLAYAIDINAQKQKKKVSFFAG